MNRPRVTSVFSANSIRSPRFVPACRRWREHRSIFHNLKRIRRTGCGHSSLPGQISPVTGRPEGRSKRLPPEPNNKKDGQ
jgi:hypothetical protein